MNATAACVISAAICVLSLVANVYYMHCIREEANRIAGQIIGAALDAADKPVSDQSTKDAQ